MTEERSEVRERHDVTTGSRVPKFDLGVRPFLVLFELTRACDLACRHCRAEAIASRDPRELSTVEVQSVFDDLAQLGAPRPIVVLTGGDPFKRPDLAELVAYGAGLGLAMAVSPSGTPLATKDRLAELRQAGARVVSFSIDGASAASHDAFRGVEGSYHRTLAACQDALEVGLRLQVNTTVTAGTVGDLPDILRLVRRLPAGLWSVFFLVETGRGRALQSLSPDETEDVLHFLYEVSDVVRLKTTEAPQYHRVVAMRADPNTSPQQSSGGLYRELVRAASGELASEHHEPVALLEELRPHAASHRVLRPPLAVGDGRGVVFVSHIGEVCPSGFLPVSAGNVRETPITTIYREAELFQALRDPDRLAGRCGRCEYRAVCGGSRARAYAVYGDPLAEDPGCSYLPPV